MTSYSLYTKILHEQHFGGFSHPIPSHEVLETLQGCSLRAHSHSGAGMQMFVWFCRMYTLGIRVPWQRKWITRFEFSSSYSYPVRRQAGRGKKTQEEDDLRKEMGGVGDEMTISGASVIRGPHLFCLLLAQHRGVCHNCENTSGGTVRWSLTIIISLGIF